MLRRPPISTRTDTRIPYATRSRAPVGWTYVVLGKHHLNWSALQSDAIARDRDLVSIVIPVHGQPELTAACFASLYEIEAGCPFRSDEHTSELKSLMSTSYAASCLTKKHLPCNPHTQITLHTV